MTTEPTPETYLEPLRRMFGENADAARAEAMAKYMKNRFVFWGIPTPRRKELTGQFIAACKFPPHPILLPCIQRLWELPEREFQYSGWELLASALKKRPAPPLTPAALLEFYEYMITHKSWWDTVDMAAQNLAGELLRKNRELIPQTVERWLRSGNLWLKRTAILFQNRFREETDETLLFHIIRETAPETDFFIRKAAGWALREYAKSHPRNVLDFLNGTPLSPLTQREALKGIKKSE